MLPMASALPELASILLKLSDSIFVSRDIAGLRKKPAADPTSKLFELSSSRL